MKNDIKFVCINKINNKVSWYMIVCRKYQKYIIYFVYMITILKWKKSHELMIIDKYYKKSTENFLKWENLAFLWQKGSHGYDVFGYNWRQQRQTSFRMWNKPIYN